MNRTSARTRLALGSAAAVLTFGGGLGIAAASGGSTAPPQAGIERQISGTPALADGEALDLQAVVGPKGALVGFLPADGLDGDVPLKLSAGGKAVEVRGQLVRAERDGGPLVGYLVTGSTGFVSIDQARDPAGLARIEATWTRDKEAAKTISPEVKASIERMDREALGG